MTRRRRTLYAVGDVHGCLAALLALLDRVEADSRACGETGRPRVVFLGDLVDRGPDSRGVLDLLATRRFSERFEWDAVRGNHDQFVLDALRDPESDEARAWLMRHGGAEMMESYGIDLSRCSVATAFSVFQRTLPPEHRVVLDDTLQAFREGELFLAHAGIDPDVALDRQVPATTREVRGWFLRRTGPFEARVVHGHTPTATGAVEVHPHRIAVDTGAGFEGGRLSAAAVRPDGEVRTLSVPADLTPECRPAANAFQGDVT